MPEKQVPETIDEAVGVVIAALSDEERARITDMAQSELIGLHLGRGTWIRNNIGLWKGNDTLMRAIGEGDPSIHPDDASMVIIEEVWQRLREMVPKVH
ncbi:MAG: hypothetical protein XXXNARYT_003397 [Candidatus Accumulibacter regalis]|jgi:hypothetical protein|uniref:DUF6794 domain-containing protein n=1 Tax=Candidatus Accumulibacter sp. ACC005 TaxID=2823331 RepID=UPI0025BFE4C1|nr:DUF6794 domain-containing protein [Candidatus Accumulibacter sp. ACC005]